MPAASTAILEFQQVSADGDFGLRCLDNSVVTITGQPRTAGKLVTQCKLTADVVSGNLAVAGAITNGNSGIVALDPSDNSILAGAFADNTTSGTHGIIHNAPNVTNVTQTVTVWLARGSGLNNRYVRVTMGNSTVQSSVTSGFYSDIDLQAGTAGTVTAIGTGTATSVSITAVGRGYYIKMTGKVSSGLASPSLLVNSCSGAGTLSYVGNTTTCFHYYSPNIVTAASISDTLYNVDTDTGWLSGDAVCMASTTRTATDCSIYSLNADAGASSFTSALYPGVTRHGTAPTQAEIGLITRNVKIRSTSPTLMSYVYCTALSTVTASWVEFCYVGTGANNKRGIVFDSATVCNPKIFTYCSVHDMDSDGVYIGSAAATSVNVVFSNSVVWNGLNLSCINVAFAYTAADWTLDNNLAMRVFGGVNLADVGGTFTNNTIVGCTSGSSNAIVFQESSALGTFTGNTVHSNAATGLAVNTATLLGTISDFTAWRNTGVGVYCDNVSGMSGLYFTDLTLFGNSATLGNFRLINGDTININSGVIAGDASFPVQSGFNIGPTGPVQLNLSSVDMSGTGTGLAPHTTNDFLLAATSNLQGFANNCKFGAPNLFSTAKTTWASGANIGFQKYNQTAGDHRTEMTYGQLRTDSAVYHTASPSTRMTPNNASNKLTSATTNRGTQVAVASGDTVTASVWIRKDATYTTGSQPRLIVRANAAIGIDADTVLATASDVTSAAYTTWDISTAIAVTLSGGDLVTTSTGTTATDQGIHGSAGKTSGKHYFEMTWTTLTGGGNRGVGIGTPASTYTGMGQTGGVTGVMMFISSTIYSMGSTVGGPTGTWSAGQKVGMAVDLDNRKMWFRSVPSGDWNYNASYNPATNVGGITIPAGTMVPFITFGGSGGASGNVFTTNFGASSFTGTVPSGFTSGWVVTPYAGTATWVQLSGTTVAATDDGVMEFIVDCDGTSGFINLDDWSFA